MGHRWTFLEKACSGVSCYRCDWKCRSGPDLCESGLDLDITFRAILAPPYRRALFTQITPSAIQTGENETEKYLAKKISLQRVHTRKTVEHQDQSKMSFFKLISRDKESKPSSSSYPIQGCSCAEDCCWWEVGYTCILLNFGRKS